MGWVMGIRRQFAEKWHSRRTRRLVGHVIAYVMVMAGALIFLLPLYYLLNIALSSPESLGKYRMEWIPRPIMWSNFSEGWVEYYDFTEYLRNTVYITSLAVIGQLLSNTLVAYGFARVRFAGRNMWFIVLLSTMMLPGQVTLVPKYVIFAKLKWVNTYKPLIVPQYFASAFYVFLLRQFFMTLPRELDDAARIDGCGHMGILVRILLPLAKAPLVAVAVFSFVDNWSAFFGPLIYLNDPKKWTLVLGTTSLITGWGNRYIHVGYVMAVVTLTIIPVLVIYYFAQRYFIEGITLTGVLK